MIMEDGPSVKKRCEDLFNKLNTIDGFEGRIIQSEGKIGGGSYPLDVKETYSIEILNEDPVKLESFLRLSKDHIISTVYNGYVHLNALTIFDSQFEEIYETLKEYYEK